MENPPAHAVAIVEPHRNNKNKFAFQEEVLEEILLQNDIKDRLAIVVTVTGAFRQGKSFLLDFCLRYLQFMFAVQDQETEDWLEDENSPLQGFSWRGGSERNTIGILMWSEIFKVDLPTGEKAAIILLDTQGSFDDKSTVRECATVFALSTMLSSVQIFNLFHNLREDHLQHLELFAEYGRQFGHDMGHKPFQRLQFLIRDWSWPYEKDYGQEGGRVLLEEKLQITADQAPEQRSLRNNINNCFTDIQCFLMPHPGSKVATNPDFDGRLSDIDEEFKNSLRQFVLMLFSPETLIPKKIGGQKIRVWELLSYFRFYKELFNCDDLPEPKSMLLATAEANNLSAVAAGTECFNFSMMKAIETKEPYLTEEELENEFQRSKIEAVKLFHERPKMGGEELAERYRTTLIESIESDYTRFKTFNKGKAVASNQLALTAAKESYSWNMAKVCEDAEPYLSVQQFKQEHEKNLHLAFRKFRNNSRSEDVFSNEYSEKLEKDILMECHRFQAFNKNKAETNNQAAIIAAKEIYNTNMNKIVQTSNETYLSSEKLEQMHLENRTKAIEHFNSRCIPNGDEFSDQYRKDLIKDVDDDYKRFESFNKNKKKSYMLRAVTGVKDDYHRKMTAVCEASSPYLTDDELEAEHLRCQSEAMQKFTVNQGSSELDKINLNEVGQFIDMDYNRFKNFNRSRAEAHIQSAFSAAKEAYYRQMTNAQINLNLNEFEEEHLKCKSAALQQFINQCKVDTLFQTYRNKLDQEIEIDRKWFKAHYESIANAAHAVAIRRDVRRMDIVRDMFSGGTAGAVLIGTAAGGPLGVFFGAIWGAMMGRGIGAWARNE